VIVRTLPIATELRAPDLGFGLCLRQLSSAGASELGRCLLDGFALFAHAADSTSAIRLFSLATF
jgi:hypothetical protein